MISNFFVLSPRGDTIISKQYRTEKVELGAKEVGAHERSHTEAFFRKCKFWDDSSSIIPGLDYSGGGGDNEDAGRELVEAISTVASEVERSLRKKVKSDAPPIFRMPDGLCYFHIKRNGLIFAASTATNSSPNMVIQLLTTIARIFKDYCGTLSEEAIRRNFILCYELLDEMIDYGYPQVTRTDTLKSFVYNEPILVEAVADTGSMVNPKTASATAVHKPVISSVNENGRKSAVSVNQKNEIFVDILERLNVLFSNNGYVLNSTIDGCIQMKSYLAGNPELRLALNEDLVIASQNNGEQSHYGGTPSVTVDDMNFNDCVNLSEFENARTLSFVPPDGEFVVISYRVTGDFSTPFRIFPSIEEVEPKKLEIILLIRAEMPSNHFGANVSVELPLPKSTVAASCNVISSPGTQSYADYEQQNSKIVWTMKKFPGGSEQTMRCKVTLSEACTTHIRKEIGPVNMSFEIPMYNVSNLQVRYLRVAEAMVGYTPYRWVRYVTQTNSYVCRI